MTFSIHLHLNCFWGIFLTHSSSEYEWFLRSIWAIVMKMGLGTHFTPTMLLALTLRITWLCNSHQFFLTQCLLSALRITPPAFPIWSFYSLFFFLACKLPWLAYKESTNSHSPFFLYLTVKRRRDVSNLFHYFLDHTYREVRVDLGVMTMKGYSPNLQNWSLTIKCSLVSYLGHHPFVGSGEGLTPLQEIPSAYSNAHN